MNSSKEGSFDLQKSSFEVKVGLTEMLRGGVIVEVTSAEEALLAEQAGAFSVIASHPNNRMALPEVIQKIQEAVTIPVIAACSVGHVIEAQILEALFVDFIDENEMLVPIDEDHPIDKHSFRTPFIASASNLGEALHRISEGATLIRTKREKSQTLADVIKQLRDIKREILLLSLLEPSELLNVSKKMSASYRLLEQIAENKVLPVPLFADLESFNPADAALVLQYGAESIIVNHTIFSEKDPIWAISSLVAE